MTLFALITLCAGGCVEWNIRPQLMNTLPTLAACETASLDKGMQVVLGEVRTFNDEIRTHIFMPGYRVVKVPPYVTYTVCRSISAGDDYLKPSALVQVMHAPKNGFCILPPGVDIKKVVCDNGIVEGE